MDSVQRPHRLFSVPALLALLLCVAPAGAQTVQDFSIAIGDTVSDGVPAAGAGNIENPNDKDVYTFTATAGQVIFVDRLANGIGGLRVELKDSLDDSIFVDDFIIDIGLVTLELGGTYTLTVGDDLRSNVGTYSFRLIDVPAPDTFAIALDDIVSDGVPGAGAGNIEVPGAADIYTFEADPGQVIFFDRTLTNIGGVIVELTDDQDEVVIRDNFIIDIGIVTLERGGTYTLTIGDTFRDNVGTYAFQLIPIPPPDMFTIAIDDEISDGVPGAGAGNIERPGYTDIYTFEADPGQTIFFDRTLTNIGGVIVELTDDQDEVVFRDNFIIDIGIVTLERGGTYTLTIGDTFRDNVGTYAFRLWSIPPPDVFEIGLGETVSDGVPGAGAGNIEQPGATDVYGFSVGAGTTVSFDKLQNGIGGVRVRLFDPDGVIVFTDNFIVDINDVFLEKAGGYTLQVGDDFRDNVGTYSFVIKVIVPGGPVPPPESVAPGDRLGSALAIDGNLLVIGAPDDPGGGTVYVYRFEGNQTVFEEAIPVPAGFTAENFGAALALEGDQLVIGAPQETVGRKGAVNSMRAAIFQRVSGCQAASATCWELKQPVTPDTDDAMDGFGMSVALTGNVIVVGAPGDASGEAAGQGSGAAFVFDFDGDNLVQTTTAKPLLGQPGAGFGSSTAASGGAVAIGAPGGQIGAVLGGAATLYGLVGANLGQPQSVSVASADPNARFGASIALAGEAMVVGAPGDSGAGTAAIFRVGSGSLVRTQVLAPEGGAVPGQFGAAVAVSGTRVVVGAPAGDGAVFRFEESESGFEQADRTDGEAGSALGASVAVAAGRAAFGAPETTAATGSAQFQLLDDVVFESSFE